MSDGITFKLSPREVNNLARENLALRKESRNQQRTIALLLAHAGGEVRLSRVELESMSFAGTFESLDDLESGGTILRWIPK